MVSETLKCPNCGTEIPLSDALQNQIRNDLKVELEEEFKSKFEGISKRQAELLEKEKELKAQAEAFESELEKKVAEERKRIEVSERKKLTEEYDLLLSDLKDQVSKKTSELKESKKRELELVKKERELEEAKQDLELEIEKKLKKEREEIRKKAREAATEEYELALADKNGTIESLKTQIDALKKKAEQGSQQAQGETLELILEDMLQSEFPVDNITPVPKGVTGADIIQVVCDDSGKVCGSIIWESKRTKSFSSTWIQKLKEDQRSTKADIAVIVSTALPKEIDSFGVIENVWATNPRYAKNLAMILRMALKEISASKTAAVGKGKKMEILYTYLSGAEFRQRFEAIVEGFEFQRKQLEKEKIALNKLWAQREKEIEKVLLNTAGLYGDLQGIIGASLPEIKSLELKALPDK